MNNLFLHIPHSSRYIPKIFWKNITTDKKVVKEFINDITDTGTDKLFGKNKYKKLVCDFSRVFCDVEKFDDDSKEIMSQFGMGVIYTKTNKGQNFFSFDSKYKDFVINNYYKKYHKKLDKEIGNLLKKGKTILIDCHSFSKDIIMFEDKKDNLPDICIGYNNYNNSKLLKFVIGFLNERKYKLAENYPYDGCMTPNTIINNRPNNYYEIMFEINKELYMNDEIKFKKLQQDLNLLFSQLENIELD